MAPGSHPCHAQLGTRIQMLLGTLLNKRSHPKRCMKSSPHRSFCQVHQRRPSDDNKFCMDSLLQVQASRPKPAGATDFQPHPVCSFGPSWSKEWLPCLVSSSRLSYKRARVTQGLPCIPPGVALDKTPSTSKKKFSIGHLTSRMTSINFFKKGVSFWSWPR